MRKLLPGVILVVLVAACGGDGDVSANSASDLPDPCSLISDSILVSYFDEPVEPEPGETGPLATCRWDDPDSGSLLIQVADDFEVNQPDPCDGCLDLTFADDGYAWGSGFQSGAKFISGTTFYSLTSTAFGDDAESMATLAETIYEALGT